MRLPSVAAVSLLFFACPSLPPVDEEGCEHLQSGPSTEVTAVSEGDGPLVADDHQRYDITLVPLTGGNGGSVRFAADEDGEFIVYLDEDVPLAVTDGSGNPVAAEESSSSSETCTEVRGRIVFDLTVGTYHLHFGPTQASEVGVVIEHGAHAEH